MHVIVYTDKNSQEYICTSAKHMEFMDNVKMWAVSLINERKTAEKLIHDRFHKANDYSRGYIRIKNDRIKINEEDLSIREATLNFL